MGLFGVVDQKLSVSYTHLAYDSFRAELGAVLCRGALQSGAEPGVERFQVCKAVAEGNVGQAVR